jgi:hypothetical protein
MSPTTEASVPTPVFPTEIEGSATLVVEGGLQLQTRLRVGPGISLLGSSGTFSWWSGPPDLLPTLLVHGPLSDVSTKTSRTLELAIGLTHEGSDLLFASDHGECQLTYSAGEHRIAGEFVCEDLLNENGQVAIDAHGSFTAEF